MTVRCWGYMTCELRMGAFINIVKGTRNIHTYHVVWRPSLLSNADEGLQGILSAWIGISVIWGG